MHFLLSNDDGYQATGLRALVKAIQSIGEVSVVAPDRDRSCASNSLTLKAPLYVQKDPQGFYYVNGTPTDCVHIAITGLLDNEPDMVLSGINAGSNLGDDILYSGTVAAAMEGRFLGSPAVSFSLARHAPKHFDDAAKIALKIVNMLIEHKSLAQDLLLNVNIPDLPYEEIKGIQITRLGSRHKSEPVQPAFDPKGQTVYWVGPVGSVQDAGEGTDFFALRNGYVSITPLHIDLTHYQSIELLQKWAEKI